LNRIIFKFKFNHIKLVLIWSLAMGNILIVILSFFLFVTNPEQEEFDQFVRTKISTKTESGNALVDALAGAAVARLAKDNTRRRNYYLFSIYTVDLSLLVNLGQNVPQQLKFIGIANQIFTLN